MNTKCDKKCDRPAIDLICVVDVSGSMIGKKINLVKDSLRYLMKILSS
jgi:Mg-chelatase subunit ChlD